MYNHNFTDLVKPEEVLVYLRKSRTDDPLLSVEEVLAKHETILNEWVERNLSTPIPPENKFREVVSGETISDRPEVQKVLKLIESPKYKAILIVEVQRLSRGDLEDAGRLIKLLRYTNTLVITPTKTYDLVDEYDRDIFERELKRGNEFLEYQKKIMNRGRLLSVSQGNYLGSAPPYGYDRITITEGKRKCPTLAINEEQAEIVRMIFDMYVNKNMRLQEICYYLDDMCVPPPKGKHWSKASMDSLLTNIHYIGKVCWNRRKATTVVADGEIRKVRAAKNDDWLVYDGKHPAIISEELYYAAQNKRGKHPRNPFTTKIRNPFAGLLYCKCGRAMSYSTYTNSKGEQKCQSRLVCLGQNYCNTGSCLYTEMIDIIVEILKQKISEYEIEAKNTDNDSIKQHTKLIKSLEKKLSLLEAKELSQWEAQSDPDPNKRMPQHIFQTLNSKLLKEKEDVQEALRKAYDTTPAPLDYEQRIITLKDALNALTDDTKSGAEKNRFLKACIERIEYSRPRLARGARYKDISKNPPIEISVKLKV